MYNKPPGCSTYVALITGPNEEELQFIQIFLTRFKILLMFSVPKDANRCYAHVLSASRPHVLVFVKLAGNVAGCVQAAC